MSIKCVGRVLAALLFAVHYPAHACITTYADAWEAGTATGLFAPGAKDGTTPVSFIYPQFFAQTYARHLALEPLERDGDWVHAKAKVFTYYDPDGFGWRPRGWEGTLGLRCQGDKIARIVYNPASLAELRLYRGLEAADTLTTH
jgi:hypothetical protein